MREAIHNLIGSLMLFLFFSAMVLGQSTPAVGSRYALLVGINKYVTADVPSLHDAVNDVEVMREVLIKKFGFLPTDITVLTDRNATRSRILQELRRLNDICGPNDVIYVHFSGYGNKVRDDHSDERDGFSETIVPADAVLKDGEWTQIRDDTMAEYLGEAARKTPYVFCVFDTGFGGRVRRGETNRSRSAVAWNGEQTNNKSNQARPGKRTRPNPPRARLQPEHTFAELSVNESIEIKKESLDKKYTGVLKVESNGALTYYLAKALWRADANASYRDIVGEVNANLTSEALFLQAQFDGAVDVPVLGGAALWKNFGPIVEHYESEIARNPRDSASTVFLAEIYRIHKKYDECQRLLDRQLVFAGRSPSRRALEVAMADMNFDWGEDLLKNSLDSKAISHFQIAAENYQRYDLPDANVSLLNLALIYGHLGLHEKSVQTYQRAVDVARTAHYVGGEADALSGLFDEWYKLHEPNIAILFAKQAINDYQEIRSRLKKSDDDLQKQFLRSKEAIYRSLADLLIEKGRISEAEQVLKMLKEEETFSYLRRDDKVAKDLLQTISLTDREKAALLRYNELADKITAIGKEFGELNSERKKYEEGKFPRQVRYDELNKELADARTAFEKYLDELKATFGQKDERVVQVDSSLQNTLKRLNANRTAVVSTIVGEDRLNLIVTTVNTQRAHTIENPAKEINQLVAEFRRALTDPLIDPRPAGQKLYDILVKPVEGDLNGIDADTILWSLDGTLRYIPVAALWDKDKGYLAERFGSVVLTLASRDTLALPVSNKQGWNALGVGVSKPTVGFTALDAVPDELDCIVTDPQNKTVSVKPICQTGVINGRKLLDEKFTATAFENALGRYPIVHIASHFSLNPGNDKDSFLLLGGGEQKKFTVEDLRSVSLTEVELLVLSACNTATPGGEKANGVEIEGFGAVAQKQGAKAVIATLWPVADESTRDLMVRFYQLYDKTGLTKAEAMRQVQVEMLHGKDKSDARDKTRGAGYVGSAAGLPFKKDPSAPFAHPYYWAPFVLFGNWK